MANKKNGMHSNPNNSKLKKSEEIGQFVIPQNTATIPHPAHNAGDKFTIFPKAHPNVATMN